VLDTDSRAPPVERKGREGRKEILSYFASFATSAFDRDVPWSDTLLVSLSESSDDSPRASGVPHCSV